MALGTRGAAVADVRGAFDGLTTAAGASADVMLGALRAGTLGTISDFDLMSKANVVLGSGLVKTSDDMGTLAAGAKLLADRTGGDTATAFDTLTGAMASGRTASLRQMGLFVDTDAAVKNYAASLGKSVKDLSDTEVAQAKSAATLAALKAQLDAAGPATADFGDQIDRGKVAVQNFTDNLAVAIATSPVVAAGMDAISSGMQAAFGGDKADMVKTLMGFVNDFAIGLTYVAQVAITGAGVFVSAWFGIKTIVLGVVTAVSLQIGVMAEFIAKTAEFAASIPGAGQAVQDLATKARDFADGMRGATISLAEETAEAARGVTGNSDLHRTLDALGGGVLAARDAMEAAAGATAGLTEKAVGAVQPLTDVGTAAATVTMSMSDMLASIAEQYQVVWDTAMQAGAIYTEVQNAITLANSTGIAQRLAAQEIDKAAELAALQEKLVLYPAIYDELAALVTEKYRIMGAAAQGFHTNIVVQANMAGFQTRAELEATAANAIDTYDRMRESNKFTTDEMRKAWEKMEEAKRAATGATRTFTVASVGEMLTATAGALQSFGVAYKAAALAGAILSGWAAIQKAWASAPFPANLPGVAIVTTATLLNISKIRSAGPGFAQGTPGTRFQDFGRVSTVDLHGPEAIVTPKQGASVAGMVEDALRIQDARTVEEIRGLREDMAADRKRQPIMLRDAVLLAGA